MKKYLLPLLTTLIIFTSCQKEDDILQPIPQNPTNNSSCGTNTFNGDTLQVDSTLYVDTINISTLGPDSCLISSPNFVCLGKNYDIVYSSFYFESYDTIYGFEHNNYGSVSFNMDGMDTLTTRVYPRNGYTSQTHSMNMSSPVSKFSVRTTSYTPGIVVLGLSYTNCLGITVDWDVTMQVLEYVSGDIGLKVVNNGYSGPHPSWSEGPWSSVLFIQLRETP
jgi:hypothetical protein|tara:strand:+ start:122 stop:784 length:663 start_codon:yes stop_codon:yes gene_type:complete